MKRARGRITPWIAAACVAGGCEGAAGPEIGVDVILDLELSSDHGSPGDPVGTVAVLESRGAVATYFACNPIEGPAVWIEGADGSRVHLEEPSPALGCPASPQTLEPGEYVSELTFRGSVWDPSSLEIVDAPAGEYAFVTGFWFPQWGVESRATFVWTAAP